MRRRILPKIALFLALIFLGGCGGVKSGNENDDSVNSDGSVTLEGRYEITGEAELDGYQPNHMALVGGRLLIFGVHSEPITDEDGIYISSEYEYRLFSADPDTMETSSIVIGFKSEGYCDACGFDDDGNILMVESISKDRKNYLNLDFISADGELIRSRSLDELIRTGFMNDVCYISGTWYVSSGSKVVALDQNGEVTGKYDVSGEITGLFNSGDTLHAYTVDNHYILGSSGFSESQEWKKVTDGTRRIFPGGSYDYLKAEDTDICGYTLAGDRTPLLNWMNSDLSRSNTGLWVYSSDDVIYLCVFGGFESYETRVVRMERREGYSIPASNVITIYYGENGYRIIPIAAVGFNTSQSEYRVICHEVSEGDNAVAAESLNLLLAGGKAGDIIEITYDTDVQSYISKGVFLNMYDLGLSGDELFGCVKELCETDGCLYTIPVNFSIRSLFGSSDFHPGGQGWTVDEFISEYKAAENNGGYLTANDGRTIVLQYIQTGLIMSYVDFASKTCSFDDPSFIEILKWLQSLPENKSFQGGMTRSAEYFRDGTVRLENKRISMPQECFSAFSLFGEFGSSGIVGYPTPDGGRAAIDCERYYGINSSCKNPEAAMKFLRYMLGGDALKFYYSIGTFGFPALKSMLSDVMENVRGYEYMIDPANLPSISGSSAGFPENDRQDNMIYIKIDDETISRVTGFIENVRPRPVLPHQLTDIFYEELTYLFGGRSAEDTAKNIQSRIGIWLAERQ